MHRALSAELLAAQMSAEPLPLDSDTLAALNPMVGNVPDYAATLTQYASLHEQPDIADSAPVYRNLFMLGALGSRGLCTAR
ncbi:hypothetical protein BCR59_26575 [Klebsiella pneumoniae]|nr:hypothetical protein BCR59_26575 [Klebsiella pneumoniae]